MNRQECLICHEKSDFVRKPDLRAYLNCPRCGSYRLYEDGCEVELRGLEDRQRSNISGWLRENQNSELNQASVEKLLTLLTPSFHERADKLLSYLGKRSKYAGFEIEYNESWISFAWCLTGDELNEIIAFLCSSNRIKRCEEFPENTYKILPDGWAHLEKLKETNTDSQQGFVAMWFDERMKHIFEEAIYPGIDAAGYDPHKVTQREYTGKICDEIIAQIRRSRFVVADFTGHRGGVYYEAGFAQGLGLEVIWTCRKDEMKKLHFDIRQYNCIDWDPDNLSDFRKRLENRIVSVLGRGKRPLK